MGVHWHTIVTLFVAQPCGSFDGAWNKQQLRARSAALFPPMQTVKALWGSTLTQRQCKNDYTKQFEECSLTRPSR
jgi:hypothetical protein